MTGYPTEVVFVFGSNRAGRHGKGAAADAHRLWGAEMGVGEGPTGNAYAIPTKDENLNVLTIREIEKGFRRFAEYARTKREMFILTPIGTGLAGYPRAIIREMIAKVGLPPNVMLTGTWI